MHTERLMELKHMLLNHKTIFPKRLFEMEDWFDGCPTKKHDTGEHYPCGTAACALGSAACYPPFMDDGLTVCNRASFPVYKDEEGLDAGATFFGITRRESEYLFMPEEYLTKDFSKRKHITPARVAKRVEALLTKEKNSPLIYTL